MDYYDRYGKAPNAAALGTVLSQIRKDNDQVDAAWKTIDQVQQDIFSENLAGSVGLARDWVRQVGLYEGYKDYLEKSLALIQEKRKRTETYLKAEEYWREFKQIGRNMLDGGSWLFDLTHAKQRAQERIKDMRHRVPTGFHALDLALKGGFGAELIYLIAPWETGKTLFETNLIFNWLFLGISPLIFTFEEGQNQYLSRVEQLLYGVSYERLARVPKKVLEFLKNLMQSLKADVHVKWFPADTVKVSALYEYVQYVREVEGFFPDIVVVDGGKLVLPERAREKDYLEQGGVALQYRNYAKLDGIPWFVADQAKGEAKNQKDVGGEDIGGSVDKVRVADVALTLAQDEKMRARGQIAVSTRKGRLGRKHVRLVMQIDKESGRLTEDEDAG